MYEKDTRIDHNYHTLNWYRGHRTFAFFSDVETSASNQLAAGIGPSADKIFEIAVLLHSGTSGDYQADGINVNMAFILNQ